MGGLGEAVRIAVLGPLIVTRDGQSVSLGGPQPRRLLTVLLASDRFETSAELLVEDLWSDEHVDDWTTFKGRLQAHVSRLNKVLPKADGGPRIICDGVRYRLVVGDDELDIFEFNRWRQAATDAFRAGQSERAVRFARAALAQWRGRPFGELADQPFVMRRAQALEVQRDAVRQLLVEALLDIGRHDEAVPLADDLLAADPGNETWRWLSAMALYRTGRRGEALALLRSYGDDLRERTGLEPGPELDDLEHAILEHDPALAWVPRNGSQVGPAGGRPTAPKTFVFTALDVGPRRLEQDLDGAALRAYESEVEAAVAEHRGHVFDRTGHELCAVFEDPSGGVLAACAMARAMVRSAVANSRGYRLKVAVHTGTAEERDDVFVGPRILHVARLRDVCHAGQVLVSDATRGQVADCLPLGVRLRYIGSCQFSGLREPDRVHQLVHDELPDEFPPLPSGAEPVGRRPRFTTTFVGREREQAEVAAKLRSGPLVTITGDGGVGKTRLALEVAERVDPADYPDGVRYCDVSLADDSDGLVERLAACLDVASTSGERPRREVIQALEASRLLLVLDGCEHQRFPVARLVGEVLTSGSKAGLLVTSRVALGLAAEQVVKLKPLPVPSPTDPEPDKAPGLELLLDRARSAGALVGSSNPHLVELARQLGGLPLAIELAATRLVAIPAAELVKNLEQHYGTLRGAADVPERQRTLRATFEWSFELVSLAGRRLLAALSVFRGSWTLETAEAVAAGVEVEPDRVIPLTTELVDQSIVHVHMAPGGTARYTMLDSIRAYAAEHLQAIGRYDTVADLHADHFLDLAERAVPHRRGPDEPAWVDELAVEFDNLRAAYRRLVNGGRPADGLRLVVALGDDLLMRERLEIGRWASDLADLPAVADEPLRVEALALAANGLMVEGRLLRAGHLAGAAVHAAQTIPGARPSWIAHNVLAMVTIATSSPGVGWGEHIHAMERIATDRGEVFPRAVALWNRAMLAWLTPDVERGDAAARALMALGDEHDNPSMRSMGLLMAGRVALLRPDADVDQARDLLHQALGAAEAARNTVVTRETARELADLDDPRTALTTLCHLAQQFIDSGNLAEQSLTAVSIAEHLATLGEHEPAARALVALLQSPMAKKPDFEAHVQSILDRLDPSERRLALQQGKATPLPRVLADLVRDVENLLDEEASP